MYAFTYHRGMPATHKPTRVPGFLGIARGVVTCDRHLSYHTPDNSFTALYLPFQYNRIGRSYPYER